MHVNVHCEGGPPPWHITGRLKLLPEDFRVTEIPLPTASTIGSAYPSTSQNIQLQHQGPTLSLSDDEWAPLLALDQQTKEAYVAARTNNPPMPKETFLTRLKNLVADVPCPADASRSQRSVLAMRIKERCIYLYPSQKSGVLHAAADISLADLVVGTALPLTCVEALLRFKQRGPHHEAAHEGIEVRSRGG